MIRLRVAAGSAAVVLGLAVAAGGCGVPVQDEPDILRTPQPQPTATPSVLLTTPPPTAPAPSAIAPPAVPASGSGSTSRTPAGSQLVGGDR